jgi:hypothetical protein
VLPSGIPLRAPSQPRFLFPKVPRTSFSCTDKGCAPEDPRAIGPGLSLLGSSVNTDNTLPMGPAH